MKKVLFSKNLDKYNIKFRDYLLNKFSEYIELKKCDLLDVGCSNGRFAMLLGPYIKSYTGVEPDTGYLKIAKKTTPKNVKAKYYIGTAEKVPITNKKFDVIFFAFSWHFIKNFDKSIKEIKRLLNKKGIIVIYEPSKKTSKWASPKLTRDSKYFDKELFKRKMSDLDKGRKAISLFSKKEFRIVEKEVDGDDKPNLWIIKFRD